MRFKEIMGRLTGVSCPFFGVSWNPPENERNIARAIIINLEARRFLYQPYNREVVGSVNISVIQTRDFLTSELCNINENSELCKFVRAMRIACNNYLTNSQVIDHDRPYFPHDLAALLGELRGIFGLMIGQLSSTYGIDVEDNLASIIPLEYGDLSDDDLKALSAIISFRGRVPLSTENLDAQYDEAEEHENINKVKVRRKDTKRNPA